MKRLASHCAVLWVAAIPVGCASPQGVLFEPIASRRTWPPPPAEPRVRFVGIIDDSGDLKAARSAKEGFLAFLRGPRPPIRFTGPHSVALSETGLVAVADAAGGAVHILNMTDRSHTVVVGSEQERFGAPIGAAWVGERLFVTDARLAEVIELDAAGHVRRRFGQDNFRRPVGIAYASQRKRLYVVDGDAGRIKVFDTNGLLIDTIGHPGVETGALHFPTHLCITGDRLVVADTGNFRVQVMDLDGLFIRAIGGKGDGAGDFSLPKGVAVDSKSHIYVADAHFENIQVFDQEGRLLMAFGQEGPSPGEFSLPAGIAIDADDRIWVADSGNRRLQVFEYMREPS